MENQTMSQFDALTHALTLAVTAPSDEQAERAVELAEFFASGLDEKEIRLAKQTVKNSLKA